MASPSRWLGKAALLAASMLSMCLGVRAQNWSNPVNVSGNTDFSATPQTASGAAGDVYVVWEDDTNSGSDILFSKSSDGGATFSTPVNISPGSSFANAPRIAVGPNTVIYVVWQDAPVSGEQIFVSQSSDGGLSFSSPVALSDSSVNSGNPVLAVDAFGNVDVAWEGDSGAMGIFFSHSTDGGATYSTPVNVATNPDGSFVPQMALGSDGSVNLIWEDDDLFGRQSVSFAHSANKGGSFAAAKNLSQGPGVAFEGQLAVDAAGNINAAWLDLSTGNGDTYFSRSTDQGASFSSPLNLSATNGSTDNPRVANDSNGNIYVAWQDTTGSSSRDIFFSVSSNGGASFSAPQMLSTGLGDATFPAIATDTNNTVTVAWQLSAPGMNNIFAVRSSDGGVSFTSQNLLNDSGRSSQVELVADASGNTSAVWADTTSGVAQVYFSQFANPKPKDRPPVADAGSDQTVHSTGPNGALVTLDGSASSDPDGDALTYAWTDENNNPVGTATAMTQVTVPLGTHTFTLTVTDPSNMSNSASTHVTVKDQAPIARVGADQTVHATGPNGAAVTLDGSASSDPDGDPLTYAWTDENGNPVGAAAKTQVTVPLGAHTFTLTVKDPTGLSSSASTHVTVADQAPVARVAADQTVTAAGPNGTLVTLDGSTSSDPDGDPLTYCWLDENGVRVGTSATVQVTVPLGTHTYTLMVKDPAGLTSSGITHVTVSDTTAPVLQVSLSPTSLWPANHKLIQVTASISTNDNLDPNPVVKLVSITSNDPSTTADDIQAVSGGPVAFGTDVRAFQLRADRDPHNAPRVYTVTYCAKDASGNLTRASAVVTVSPNPTVLAGGTVNGSSTSGGRISKKSKDGGLHRGRDHN